MSNVRFLLPQVRKYSGSQWVQARDSAKHPPMRRKFPTISVEGAKVEKLLPQSNVSFIAGKGVTSSCWVTQKSSCQSWRGESAAGLRRQRSSSKTHHAMFEAIPLNEVLYYTLSTLREPMNYVRDKALCDYLILNPNSISQT